MDNNLLRAYEVELLPHRATLIQQIQEIVEHADHQTLAISLLYYCALGTAMTEPVESWIKRAGEKCIQLGYELLGAKLINHAKGEANHHLMMLKDVDSLISWYNNGFHAALSKQQFLQQSLTPSILQYRQMHENYIASDKPYCQAAIEYEIENISTTLGPPLIVIITKTFGKDMMKNLSFLESHVSIDKKHTELNRHFMKTLLDDHPETLDELIKAGKLALDNYNQFLHDCYQLAKQLRHLE